MANALGYLTATKTGFEGQLAMINLSAAIRIEKNAEKKPDDNQPDYPRLRRRNGDGNRRRMGPAPPRARARTTSP